MAGSGKDSSALGADLRAKLVELFERLDANGDRRIDWTEMARFGELATGRRPNRTEAMAQIGRADKDGDGTIDIDEWLAFSAGAFAGAEEASVLEMVTKWIADLS